MQKYGSYLDLRLAGPAALTWVVMAWHLSDAESPFPFIQVLLACTIAAISFRSWHAPGGRHRESTGVHILLLVTLYAVVVALALTTAQFASRSFTGDAVNQLIGNEATVWAKATGSGTQTKNGYRVGIAVSKVCVGERCFACDAKVNLVGKQVGDLVAGENLEARVILQPGYGRFNARATARSVVVADTSPLVQLRKQVRSKAQEWVSAGNPWAALIPGISLGDRGVFSYQQSQVMRLSSLTHLTAVSGTHTAIFLGAIIWMGNFLPRKLSIVLSLVALAAFTVLVGYAPSVIRAVTMAAIALLGQFWGRPGAGLPALCAAILLMLFADPWQSRDFGSALSVTATASLLLVAPRLSRSLSHYLPRPLATALGLALAAQLTCLPLLAWLQPGVPLGGIVANLLVAPAVPVAVLPALAGALLMGWMTPAGKALWYLADYPCRWIGQVATFCATYLPPIPWPSGKAGAALIGAVTAAFAYVIWLGQPGKELRLYLRNRRLRPFEKEQEIASEGGI